MKRLFLASFLIFFGCREQIAHNITELEANRIVARFQDSGVDVKKISQADGRWSISVAKEIAADAISFLEAEKLLSRENGETITLNPLSSADEREFALERSTSRTIEETLLTINGVQQAKVHLFLPKKDPLQISKQEQLESASVLLVTTPEFKLNSEEISSLVGGASGIKADRISVVLSKAEKREVSKFVPKSTGLGIGWNELSFAALIPVPLIFLFKKYRQKKLISFIEER